MDFEFKKSLVKVALPITFQSLLASSFSVVDTLMLGSLGSTVVAATTLGGKFASFFSVIISAIISVSGIMISQYIGKKNREGEKSSFNITLIFLSIVILLFIVPSLFFPMCVMKLYTSDTTTIIEASKYLKIIAPGFFFQGLSLLLSTLLRCYERALFPLYSSFIAALINSGLNYYFIYVEKLGIEGAAIATLISQIMSFILVFLPSIKILAKNEEKACYSKYMKSFMKILLPILFCEFFWGLGENVYASVYGHLGRDSAASYGLTGPIQSLFIGSLTGLSQASGILIGKELGKKDFEKAYNNSKSVILTSFVISIALSFVIIVIRKLYISLYNVEPNVVEITYKTLLVYGLIAPVKVLNMVIGGGIIRSGGRTDLSMYVDLIGTWGFGVPLALITSRVFSLPLYWVYFFLSLEEVVRLIMVIRIFRKKKWMESL